MIGKWNQPNFGKLACSTNQQGWFNERIGLIRNHFFTLLFIFSWGLSPVKAQDASEKKVSFSPEQLEAHHEAEFSESKFFTKVTGGFQRVVEEPLAVLLVGTTPERVQEILEDETWSRFCRRAGWSLAVIGIEENPETVAGWKEIDEARQWVSGEVFRWLDGENSPLRVLDQGEQVSRTPKMYTMLLKGSSDWLFPAVQERPNRVSAWVAHGIRRFPQLPDNTGGPSAQPGNATQNLPPGLLIGSENRDNRNHWEYMQSIRRYNPGRRLAFFPFQGQGMDDYFFEEFGRQFLLETAISSEDGGHWVRYEDCQPLTLAEIEEGNADTLLRYIWLPTLELAGAFESLALNRPTEPEYVVKMFSRRFLKPPPFFERVEFHHNQMGKEPKAILLVALDSNRPQSIFQDEKWVNFAKDQGWALMVLNLKNGRVRSHSQATEWLEQRLFTFLEKGPFKNKPKIPIVVHASNNSAYWMQRLMLKRPERFYAWCVQGATQFPAVLPGQKLAPGLIVASKPETHFPNLFFLQDVRKADQSNRLCLLAQDEGLIAKPLMDEFTREFLRGATTERKGNGFWLRFRDGKRLKFSESEQGVDPSDYVWFPNDKVAGIWNLFSRARPQIPFPKISKTVVKTRLEEQPELNLFVRLPGLIGKEKGGDEKIQGVMCFCTWQKEDATLINRLKRPDDPLVAFADRNHLAMITWNTAAMLPPGTWVQDLDEDEEREMSEKFDRLGEVWLKGVEKVCRDHKIPDGNFLLHGVSRGSTYAHRLALRHPDKFLAVHTHIASHYEAPIEDASKVLWLVTTGELDGGYLETRKFYEDGLKLNYPILIKAGPSLGHSMRDDIEALSLEFFDMALFLKNSALQLREGAARKQGSELKKITAAELFRDELKDAKFFGDFINHEVYPITEGDWIPESQRIPLSTEKLADAWGMQIKDGDL